MYNSQKQFTGSWAIVLGGSSGFGFAAIEKLTHHGMNVAVLYRETAAVERELKHQYTRLETDNQVTILPFNINALDAGGRNLFIGGVSQLIPKGSVKLLLHSIARGNLKPLTAETGNDILTVDDIQLTTYAMGTSLLDWARLLLDEQLFDADARVIGLTSEGAHRYWDGYAAVSIAKASLESLSTYMAVELAKYGLKTNILQAGVTDTPSLRRIPGSDKLLETMAQRNPMKRMTTPPDVANVIYLLCTPEAAWINGSLLHVDGGEHCR